MGFLANVTPPRRPPSDPRRRRVSVAAFAAAVLVLLGAPSVLAAGGEPRWGEHPAGLKVHSTRVVLQMRLIPEQLETHWTSELAPAKCESTEPPSEGWKTVNEATIRATSALAEEPFLGGPDPGDPAANGPIQLRHLEPGTCYFARFSASNSASHGGPAVALVPFTTLPVEKPEIPHTGSDEFNAERDFRLLSITATGVAAAAKVESNGADGEYAFEYSLPEAGHAPGPEAKSWTVFSSGSGTVTSAEDFKVVSASTSGLAPETTYYLRIRLHNEKGTAFQTTYQSGLETFTTGTAKPTAGIDVRNVTGSGVHLAGNVSPHGAETSWRFESAPAETGGCPPQSSGAWMPVAGGEGLVRQAQAEATPYNDTVGVGAPLGGLASSTSYCVRLSASDASGHVLGGPVSFETEGPPTASTFTIHRLTGESIELLGSVNPKSVATSEEQVVTVSGATGGSFTMSFQGHTTAPLAFDAPATSTSGSGSVEAALRVLPGGSDLQVEGVAGGPYTVFFGGSLASSPQPLIEADAAGLTPAPPASGVTVTRAQAGGESNRAQFWFEYVSDSAFAAQGWAGAQSTPHTDAGLGDTPAVVGLPVPGLTAGEGYRFRVLASSALSASPALGAEAHLTVPVPPARGGQPACANAAFRVGLSAGLPDCRAYEQLSPLEKGAAQEPFHYGVSESADVVVGESGDHAVLEAPAAHYGSGQSPYLFGRGAGGWSMTAGSPQPETGVAIRTPQLYGGDLTQVALASSYSPSPLSESPNIEYKLGPLGGPYHTVTSLPRSLVGEAEAHHEYQGWAAANGSFSKLVFQTSDRELTGSETGTKSGTDLYEYTPEGGFRQLNVTGSGGEAATIGSCGARMVSGEEGLPLQARASKARRGEEGAKELSSSHSVSVDGSRVFFEAAPGGHCDEANHLYMRIGGTETVDIGQYEFLAADAQGTRLVLVVPGSGGEVVGYDTETRAVESQPAGELAEEREMDALGIPARFEPTATDAFARPRDTLWAPPEGVFGQVSRYDEAEHVVECISCASPYDLSPKNPAYLGDVQGLPKLNGGLPDVTVASKDGRFAFFTTISALVTQDLDEEIPEGQHGSEFAPATGHASPSTDVYEWRAAGVDGCTELQGCLALITDGKGGFLNLLLGTADEGRDVLFYSRSALVPGDPAPEGAIAEGNVYDARIGGGFPAPASRHVECVADACSTPPAPPLDQTPASLAFSGAGNLIAPFVPPPPGGHAVKCRRGSRLVHKRCVKVKPRCRRGSRLVHGKCVKSARGRKP